MNRAYAQPPRTHVPLPHLPKPLPRAVVEDFIQVRTGTAALEAQRTTLEEYLLKVHEWLDTLKLALDQNHADYLAGRDNWTYDDRLQVEGRIRALKRQRQAFQIRFGDVNRQLRRDIHYGHMAAVKEPQGEAVFAVAFVKASQELLDPDTYSMLAELAADQCARSEGSHA